VSSSYDEELSRIAIRDMRNGLIAMRQRAEAAEAALAAATTAREAAEAKLGDCITCSGPMGDSALGWEHAKCSATVEANLRLHADAAKVRAEQAEAVIVGLRTWLEHEGSYEGIVQSDIEIDIVDVLAELDRLASAKEK
jgi:hypothetical protein